MAQGLAELKADLAGQDRAIILGKGPSLDRYQDGDFPCPVIVGINEAGLARSCTHLAYLDAKCGITFPIPDHTAPIRGENCADHYSGRGYALLVGRDYPEAYDYGTAAMATWVLGACGICELLMVGFDSLDDYRDHNTRGEYAQCIAPYWPCGAIYSMREINKLVVQAIAEWGMDARWLHRGETW